MKRFLLATVAVAATALLIAGSTAIAQNDTVAAWTDPVVFVAEATTGTWGSVTPTPSSIVIVPGNEHTSIDSTVWAIPSSSSAANFCVAVTFRGTEATPQAWELHADMSLPPFHGRTGSGGVWYDGSSQASFSTLAGSPGTLVITGVGSGSSWNSNYNNRLITEVQELTVNMCFTNNPTPAPAAASNYTITQTPTTWTDKKACVAITATGTVTDLEANPFYFGWVGTVDLTAAKNRILSAGKTLNDVRWSPSPSGGYQFSTSSTTFTPPANSYEITSGKMTAIRGTTATTITACVYGY